MISSELGNVCTIFIKENGDYTRVSTNIKTENGARAVGTKLGRESKAFEPVEKGEVYVGEAKILGKSYYTSYTPLKNEKDEIIGILFIGVERDKQNHLTKSKPTK